MTKLPLTTLIRLWRQKPTASAVSSTALPSSATRTQVGPPLGAQPTGLQVPGTPPSGPLHPQA